MRAFILLAVLAICGAATSANAALFGRAFSIAEYKAELYRLSDLADKAAADPSAADVAISELRGDWQVQGNGQTFEIRTGGIIDKFEHVKTDRDRVVLDELKTELNSLRSNVEAYEQSPVESSAERATLTKILARSEFNQVHGPTWLDRLKYRILMWIFRILGRLFGSSSAPTVGRVLVWTLVTIAVVVIAFFVYRAIKQSARIENIVPRDVTVSSKPWHVWLKEAQAAAEGGKWRDAVHLAYWAGISFLEQSGMWNPDKARTPREYLRLLSATSPQRPELVALTKRLELTWYGNQPAGPDTFAETLGLLENLGCRQL
ncbi:MAG TPA: DUF4129 domain-containing protein [Terriglobales bacterium]|nr:DUF4129 domain-containing protein [Terriglobales bacterium]